MSSWTQEEINSFAPADDFHIAPYREDGKTPGTPTLIWSVVADGELYVRPYNDPRSRWYRAAIDQGEGRIRIAGSGYDVAFTPADERVLGAVDDAYRSKCRTSPYLASMITGGPRSTTLLVTPAPTGR